MAKTVSSRGADLVRRIWALDPAVWHADPARQREIGNRLGWLHVARDLRPAVMDLVWFAREIRAEGFTRALLLGMGGSSLAPEVFRLVLGQGPRGIDLEVLDTTDPAGILAAEVRGDLSKTLFIVSSKSGGTIEVDSLFRYFFGRTKGNGRQFIAITDPGTALERLARAGGFRRVFINPPDIGGRYSALSFFGLVPAALLGADTGRLLDGAIDMMRRCGPREPAAENPGLLLGLTLGESARAGMDKVTLVLSPRLDALGLWIEQLLAESTGKDGTGLIPVAGEDLGGPPSYGADRVFVSVELAGDEDPVNAAKLQALEQAGHPVVRTTLSDPLQLGAEMFRWEFATAVAGAILRIDPFDQPNVQEAKDRTGAILKTFAESGALPDSVPGTPDDVRALIRGLRAGQDYLGILAFVPFDLGTELSFRAARAALRDRSRVATTFGFGPRYLHSTGQLHKGGPATGVFLVITCDHPADVVIPKMPYTFGQLQRAQALGDVASLTARGRRVVRLHLPATDSAALRAVCDLLAAP